MVFDLVESSDACQSDERSSTGTCICENKCTCHDPKECTCPELLPECTCDENVLDFSKFIPEQTSSLNSERVGIRTTTKINEFSQTESKNYGDRETKGVLTHRLKCQLLSTIQFTIFIPSREQCPWFYNKPSTLQFDRGHLTQQQDI